MSSFSEMFGKCSGQDQGSTYTPFKNLQSTWDKLEKTTNTSFSALPVHESMMELQRK
jgi:hypothetical protein